MDNIKIDANKVINGLLGQIAVLAQEKAMLQVQLDALLTPNTEEVSNDDTVQTSTVQ